MIWKFVTNVQKTNESGKGQNIFYCCIGKLYLSITSQHLAYSLLRPSLRVAWSSAVVFAFPVNSITFKDYFPVIGLDTYNSVWALTAHNSVCQSPDYHIHVSWHMAGSLTVLQKVHCLRGPSATSAENLACCSTVRVHLIKQWTKCLSLYKTCHIDSQFCLCGVWLYYTQYLWKRLLCDCFTDRQLQSSPTGAFACCKPDWKLWTADSLHLSHCFTLWLYHLCLKLNQTLLVISPCLHIGFICMLPHEESV